MKNTEIIRRERTLEFGDGIYFTSDNRGVVLDYEKSMKVYETNCNYDKNLIKTICVLPPFGHAMKIWSELFGNIQLSKEKWNEANLQANNDVPIFTWISIQIDTVKLKLVPEFDEFIEVAVDERKIAWETVFF
uniref:p-granule-associated protein DEPS-1 second OB-fold domain-containing protein n=1 Tax=Meloidogyne incognita TaxID=6306 RepID=A0A914NN51_MELIC